MTAAIWLNNLASMMKSMMKSIRALSLWGLAVGLGGVLAACQPFRNFTTYYNLFYNMERIMGEVEDELLYIREQKTPEPSYVIPYDDQSLTGLRVFNHLDRRTMNPEETRANKIKLDSILLKGSKLLVRSAKSDYVPDAIYYIGKTYFYERDWYLSQKKCEELINNYPQSYWYPDAHLLLAMNQMQQGNLEAAEPTISKCIDVAWGRKRADVLSEAFRLNADLYVGTGDFQKALKPYQRAMLLSTDGEELARWQYEIGLLHFRNANFEQALIEFDKVDDYSPDLLTEFQTGLQRAVTLRTLGRHDQAKQQLDELRDEDNYEPWFALVELERLNLAADQPGGEELSDSTIKVIDSLAKGKNFATYGVYERGMRAFRAGDYKEAHTNFVRVQSVQAPFQRRAQRYAQILGDYVEGTNKLMKFMMRPPDNFGEPERAVAADAYYTIARVFAALNKPDSIEYFYNKSSEWAPEGSVEAARAMYARSMVARSKGRTAFSDSLLQVLADAYATTEYGTDARARLGYTDYSRQDTARDVYTSGVSNMNVGDNGKALMQFERVIREFPKSEYAPQAYYGIGLIYETKLFNLDSALAYYSKIIELYPGTEQAIAVKPMVETALLKRSRPTGTPEEEGSAPPDGGLIPLDQGATSPMTMPAESVAPTDPNSPVFVDPNNPRGMRLAPNGTLPPDARARLPATMRAPMDAVPLLDSAGKPVKKP